MSELNRLSDYVASLTYRDIPKDAVSAAIHCILDTVSVSGGAAHTELVKNIRETYQRFSGASAQLCASLWGTDEKAPLTEAIFLNALSGHYYELDDVHCESKTHIGTVVIPAAYALAEALGASGEELLCAVVCGYEVTARIGVAFGVTSHRQLGWHSTSTAGVFGAAAACGKLLRLDPQRLASALGMAGTQAFGRWAFLSEGATCKILHPARAAQSGCEAAFLAAAGMTGPNNILTAEDGGLLQVMSQAAEVSAVTEALGERWAILNMDNKPYPCCRSTHGAIDAALLLKKTHAIDPNAIESISIDTYHIGKVQCATSEGSLLPKTPMEAKFSTPYTVSCALLRDGVGLSDFLPENIADAPAQALLRKVSVRESEAYSQAYPTHWGCHMAIVCKNGAVYETSLADASGSRDAPLSEEQLLKKSSRMLCAVPERERCALQRKLLGIAQEETTPELTCFFPRETQAQKNDSERDCCNA